MKLSYLKHFTTACQDIDTKVFIKTYGARGYGVYWLLLELLANVDENELEYNLKKLSVLIDVDESLIREIIEESGLFQVENNVFWSPLLKEQSCSYAVSVEQRKQAIRRRWDKVKSQAAQQQKEASEPQETPPEPQKTQEEPQEAQEEPITAQPTLALESDQEPLSAGIFDGIIEAWNGCFTGTKQEYRGFSLDAISYNRARESLQSGYTLDDMERAFEIAKSEDFAWLLKDVLKPENLQRLLTRGEKQDGKHGDNSSKDDGNAWGVDWNQFNAE